MFRRILVPLDGSTRAEQAIPVAAHVARASGGTLVLVRVIDIAPPNVPAPGKPPLAQAVEETDSVLAEGYLEDIAHSGALSELYVKTVAPLGIVAPAILSEAAAQHADLIILCSHGSSGATRWVMGSVAEKIVRYGSLPTLILREGGTIPGERSSESTQPLRVLVPLDGSTLAETALLPAANLAAALASPGKAALHLVHIVKPAVTVKGVNPRAATTQDFTASSRMIKQYLDATMKRIRDGSIDSFLTNLDLDITSSVSVDADVAHAITRVAENQESTQEGGLPGRSDVIAMTSYGASGLQRWSMGNVTERVLHATRLPLLIVRPG